MFVALALGPNLSSQPTYVLNRRHSPIAHLRPPCRLSVPMLAITVQALRAPMGGALGRETADRIRAGRWGALRPRAPSTQRSKRQSGQVTQGTIGTEARDTLALVTDTLALDTDTLARTHARAPTRAGLHSPTTKSRSECEPGGLHTRKVRTPLISNHAPSGWLLDRGSGLRTRPWYPDVAARTSPLASIYGGV